MKINEALFRLVSEVRQNMKVQIKCLPNGLSAMHMKTLGIISHIDNCTGQKLANSMGRDKAQINRLIKELVVQELVSKAENEQDKRSQLLILTSTGFELMKDFKCAEKRVFDRMLCDIEPEEIDTFIKTASRLTANLREE